MRIVCLGSGIIAPEKNIATRDSYVTPNNPGLAPALFGGGMATVGFIGLALFLFWKHK